MAKPPSAVAAEIDTDMKTRGLFFRTIPWSDFYKLTAVDRLHEKRKDDIGEELNALGLVVSYGRNVVAVYVDRNCAP